MGYDFSGWATRNDIKCSDGRVIRRDAFKENDGQKVPLVWNHQHNDVNEVLGHALLENRDEGVYAYGKFNNTESGAAAKLLVENGDITALSIYANRLQQKGSDVIHGAIREVSLVLAGANPGAFIDSVIKHGEFSDDEGIIYTDEHIVLCHSDEEPETEESETESTEVDETNAEEENSVDNENNGNNENIQHADNKTVGDVFNTLNEEQKNVVYALIGAALEEAGVDTTENPEGGNNMKHNVFDKEATTEDRILCHDDQMAILDYAKKTGSFQGALEAYIEENELQHDAVSSGFVQTGGSYTVTTMFPDYNEVRPGAPELLTNDQGWVTTVINKAHKSPISRIRTSQVDIRNIDALRAKGYTKGKEKKLTGNFSLIRRTTDPQTVYVKSALHRDDIIDITDFDYVQYLYNIDRMQLNEELATAIMLGDGREEGAEDKISPEHIRPIWTDDELYTIHADLDVKKARAELQGTDTGVHFGDNYVYAEAMINTVLHAREKYKGSGTPDMYITPHMLNVMLLARDYNGRRIYSSVSELASALNVGAIYTAEQFEGKTRKVDGNKTKKLLAMIVNLADYSLGATKGGEITHFTQFDIDFNQQKSLLETRCSGALTRVHSAIAIEEPVSEPSSSSVISG